MRGDKVPVYEETLEDLGRFNEQPALPFNAYGTMALARGEFEANSGSSQVFWLLKARPCLLVQKSTCAQHPCRIMWSAWRPRGDDASTSMSLCVDTRLRKMINCLACW